MVPLPDGPAPLVEEASGEVTESVPFVSTAVEVLAVTDLLLFDANVGPSGLVFGEWGWMSSSDSDDDEGLSLPSLTASSDESLSDLEPSLVGLSPNFNDGMSSCFDDESVCFDEEDSEEADNVVAVSLSDFPSANLIFFLGTSSDSASSSKVQNKNCVTNLILTTQ